MHANVNLPESGIDEVVARIFSSRQLTRADQMRFMSALLSKNSLSDRDQVQVNRVFDALRTGLIRVVD